MERRIDDYDSNIAHKGFEQVVLFEGWMLGFEPEEESAVTAVDPQQHVREISWWIRLYQGHNTNVRHIPTNRKRKILQCGRG